MTTTASVETVLPTIGNVPPAYIHEWRVAEPGPPIIARGAVFKWYTMHRHGEPAPAALVAEARQLVASSVERGEQETGYGLNFAFLHASTTTAYLIVGVWKAHQEFWETLYVKDVASGGPFVRQAHVGQDAPTLCVWELGVVQHERMAWHRYLFSPRTDADKLAYLHDLHTGAV